MYTTLIPIILLAMHRDLVFIDQFDVCFYVLLFQRNVQTVVKISRRKVTIFTCCLVFCYTQWTKNG